MVITIPIKNWKGAVFVVGLVVFAFSMHHYIYYYNPELDETITALQSDDPAAIARALLKTSEFGMEKGHKLIPYILPLLKDKRIVPQHIEQEMIEKTQSSPAAIPGMGADLRGTHTIGFSAAMTIQALIIVDVLRTRWISGKAEKRIISYINEEIDPNDRYAVANALAAVRHICARQLLPFWFECLAIESESIRIHALFGLGYYIYDRTHGLFTWKPEEEITPAMAANLKRCLNDPSYYIRQEARDLIEKMEKAGFSFTGI